jgi:type II secretory pathway component GspD/PulD (secretin)
MLFRKAVLGVLVYSGATFAFGAGAAPKAATTKATGSGDAVVKVLRTSNKAQTNRFVCEAIEFTKVNPFDVISFFESAVSREEGGVYSFANPDLNGGFLVVICPDYQLASLRQLAKELDRPKLTSAPGSKYIYYRMKHRNITDPAFRTVANYWIGSTGALLPDLETNSVVIFDAPTGALGMEKAFAETLDKPLRQVQMQVKIYEVDVNNDGTFGLDFEAWKNGPGKLLLQGRASGQSMHFKNSFNGDHNIHTDNGGSAFYLDYPSAYFDFLVAKGKAQVVTSTKISALNGQQASLSTGDQITFNEVTKLPADREVNGKTTPASVDAYPLPLLSKKTGTPTQINSVDTGIFLNITPTVGEGNIGMDVNLKVVNNSGFDNAGQPMLNSRQVKDNITVLLGNEVLFGGLTRDHKVETTQKVPFFGSLPVVGLLFGKETNLIRKTMVVTAIVPSVVKESANVTEDDTKLVDQESGEQVVVLPKTDFCVEQSLEITH